MKLGPFFPRIAECFQGTYAFTTLKADALAGLTVAVVALPLSIALAIASGADPGKGIITAVVAGFIISFLSGSRVQIGGPTGAFVVLVYSIVQNHGFDGLMLSTLMAGIILIAAALMHLGGLIRYISQSVITGFTAGIALIIFTTQLGDIFGFSPAEIPAAFLEKIIFYLQHSADFKAKTFLAFGFLFCVMFALKSKWPQAPHFLIIVIFAVLLNRFCDLSLETIGDRFHDIALKMPKLSLPEITFQKLITLIPSALMIALLAGLESLLSAIVADAMSGDRHHSNTELLAQGSANIFSALLGGIPATGAIARTATNIKTGAKTPVSGMLHALFILIMALVFDDYIEQIPFVALAAILVAVAWGMSEHKEVLFLLKNTQDDRLILLATFLLTIFVDLVVGISVGIILSSLLFVHRMSDVAEIKATHKKKPREDLSPEVPDEIFILTFTGPLFFGTVSRISDAFDQIGMHEKVIIIHLEQVPFIDESAAKKLKSFIDNIVGNKDVILSVSQDQIRATLKKLNVKKNILTKHIVSSLDEAVAIGQKLL